MKNKYCPDIPVTRSQLMSNLFIMSIIVFISLSPEILSSQNNAALESKYQILSGTLSSQKSHLDSLKKQLEEQARRIDREKEHVPANEENIKLLLAQSVKIVDRIDKQQSMIDRTLNEQSFIRENLIECYEKDLDSLRNASKKTTSEAAAAEQQTRILQITQKKLLIQPDLPALSFDPEKIMTLKIETAIEDDTKKLYSELLEAALTEVHQKRKHVGEILEEIKALNELRRRAQRFIERSDLASGPPGSAVGMGQDKLRGNAVPTSTFDGLKSSVLPQADAYVYMWHQLDQLPAARKSEWISPIDSTTIYSSPQEFYALLTGLDTRLSEYELVLKQMLNSTD